MGHDPTEGRYDDEEAAIIKALVIIGADHIANGAKTFKQFTESMYAEYGDAVVGKLKQIYQQAKAIHDQQAAVVIPQAVPASSSSTAPPANPPPTPLLPNTPNPGDTERPNRFSMKATSRREAFFVMAGLSLISAAMLGWAGVGTPPTTYYSWLRMIVAASAAYTAYTIGKFIPRLIALGFLVGGFGAMFFFNKLPADMSRREMNRREWIPFDRVGAIIFAVCTVFALYMAIRRQEGDRP